MRARKRRNRVVVPYWDGEKTDHVVFNICPEACCRKRKGGRLVTTRDTREGWPLLPVEGTQRVQMKESFLGWFVGLVVPFQETFILPWLLWSAQYKIWFSSPYTISIYVSSLPSNLGRPPCSAACLWIYVSGNASPPPHPIFPRRSVDIS